MRVFRLSKRKYAYELNGKGAAKFGNRWNSRGVEVIYVAQSRALAMAEVVVHLTLATLPMDFVMIEIDIPEHLIIDVIQLEELSSNCYNHPSIQMTQKIGNRFVEKREYVILKVPSAVVPGDYNYLINPHHENFSKIQIIEISDFPFDQRMFVQ